MAQALGAYYQCHRQPASFLAALRSFRAWYPDASLVVVSDGGEDFSAAAARFGADYRREAHAGETVEGALVYTSLAPIVAYVRRLWSAFDRIAEPYVLVLEDDVRVLARHTLPFEHEISGCNTRMPCTQFRQAAAARGHDAARSFMGGCGGTVLRRAFFQAIPIAEVERALLWFAASRTVASDQALTFVTVCFGGVVGPYEQFWEEWYLPPRRPDVAFLHKFKGDYDRPVADDDRALVGLA